MEDERAIRGLVERWMEASMRGDIATVLDLMTDDALFMVPGRGPFGREVFAALSRSADVPRIEGTNEIVELQVLGDWAFTRNRIDITTVPPVGEPFRRSGYTLTLFRAGSLDIRDSRGVALGRNQLDLAQHRVLPAGVEEPAVLLEAVRLAGQDRREIEAEAVDVHLLRPVAQGIPSPSGARGIAEIDRVAGAGVVDVVAPIRREPVVGGVVDALEGQRRAEFVALRGVVVDDVEDHLDAGIVQARDHLLELGERRRVAR